MHTKTHMWGRRCERGVRVLRACAHGASICVAVAPRRVSAMDTNVANLRVAFLTRPVGRGGAHGAFVSGRVVARPTFFCMLLLLPSAAWSLVSQAAMASSRNAQSTSCNSPQSAARPLGGWNQLPLQRKCDSNASYLQRQALTPRTIHYGHTRIRPIRRTRACSLVGMAARR